MVADDPTRDARDDSYDRSRLTAFVRGHVQGVGFRWWVTAQARELNLTGYARNLPDGRVEVLAQGRHGDCAELLARLVAQPGTGRRPGQVRGVTEHWLPPVRDHGTFREY